MEWICIWEIFTLIFRGPSLLQPYFSRPLSYISLKSYTNIIFYNNIYLIIFQIWKLIENGTVKNWKYLESHWKVGKY